MKYLLILTHLALPGQPEQVVDLGFQTRAACNHFGASIVQTQTDPLGRPKFRARCELQMESVSGDASATPRGR